MRHRAAIFHLPDHLIGISSSLLPRMMRPFMALLLAMLIVGQGALLASAQSTPEASPAAGGGIDAAVAWLTTQQDETGGFIGFSGEPDAGITIDALYALSSAPEPDTASIDAAVAFLLENGADYAAAGPAQASKLAMALVIAGHDPGELGLPELISAGFPSEDDVAGGDPPFCGFGPFDHALCLLGLVATGQEIGPAHIEPLVAAQVENGGWAFDGSTDPATADSNTTSIVIQALIAAGIDPTDPLVQNGLGYLASVIDPEQGGFAYDANTGLIADANSTAVAIQALIAAGEDASSDEWGRATDALAGFQNASGAFRYQHEFPDDNLYATVQVIPALAGTAFPLPAI